MREIKFRAWDSNKKLFPFIGFNIIGEVTAFDLIKSYQLTELNSLDIQQYTGLKDKNGVEIYEGDILTNDSGWIAEIVWGDAFGGECIGFYAKEYFTRSDVNTIIESEVDFWVCGNIYENPELLK